MWLQRDKTAVVRNSRVALTLSAVGYVLHYLIIDSSLGLTHDTRWFWYRFGLAASALAGVSATLVMNSLHPILVRLPLGLFGLAAGALQAWSMTWYREVPYFYAFIIPGCVALLLRASAFTSGLYILLVFAFQFPAFAQSETQASLMWSALLVTIVVVAIMRARMQTEIDTFLAEQVRTPSPAANAPEASRTSHDVRRPQPLANDTIGHYSLRQRLGAGGMGEVWEAWDNTLGREVALKLLLPEAGGPAGEVRFQREIRATIELTHPNIIRIFDCGKTEDGLLYYAMERLYGDDLGALVQRAGPLPPARAVYLVLQVTRALVEAHARGIVHRDLKPENIFVSTAGAESDFVKVLDFGIARVETSEADLQLTLRDAMVGSPRYMAPEVMRGNRATARADVYAIGAVLHFALTGRPPYAMHDRVSLIAAVVSDTPLPPIDVPHASVELKQLVAVALAKEPLSRFESAEALRNALMSVPEASLWQPTSAPLRAKIQPPRSPGTTTPASPANADKATQEMIKLNEA